MVAVTEVTFCVFRKTEFEKLVARTPRIGLRLLEITLDELDCARDWMLLLGRKTAREKLASLFVIMARRDATLNPAGISDARQFPLYISRDAIADYLGLTIETVSRQITVLRKEGLVILEENRVVRVPDFGKLLAEAGDGAGCSRQ